MLKVKIEDVGCRTDCIIMGSGDVKSITAEVGMVIQGLHTQLMQTNPMLATAFRQGLTHLLVDPTTPLWNPTQGHKGMCIVTPNNSKEEL